jgi:hypothetical protein
MSIAGSSTNQKATLLKSVISLIELNYQKQ